MRGTTTMVNNFFLKQLTVFDVIRNLMNEGKILHLFIGFVVFALVVNTIRYVIHHINYSNYNKNRKQLFKKQKKKCKVDRINKALVKNENYNKLSSKNKKRLEAYIKFLIKDIKYNIYCENFSFTKYKRVTARIEVKSNLGSFKGKPRKVFLKMSKASKRKSGLLDAIDLLEEIAYQRNLYGLKSKETEMRLNYTLSWTE